jgi:uncharacterized protein (DUF2141 family)
MKKILFVLFLISCFTLKAQESSGVEISVTIPNVPGDKGKVMISLYNQDNFLREPLQKATSAVENNRASVVFKNVEPGTYAIAAFHDKNENGKIDMDEQGRPVEAYGVSNNPMSFGPPQWNSARFEVGTDPLEFEIRF